MTMVHLIRHGSYKLLGRAMGGRADHPLDGAGRAQAAAVAARLGGRPIAAVLASPVLRAQQTAAPLAAALGLAVQTAAEFTEIDFGAWTGAGFDQLETDPRWTAWNAWRSMAAVPGGETMLAAQARAVAGLLRVAGAWPHHDIALVSHADIIKAVLLHILGAPLDMLHRLDIAPASTSTVSVEGPAARVLAINLLP